MSALRSLPVGQKHAFCYVTEMNEDCAPPDLPKGLEARVFKYCYKYGSYLRNADGGYDPVFLVDSSTKRNGM